MAEFASKRDRERVWEGSPWHISKHAVILSEFNECMKPSGFQFNKLQLWARVPNLPFNLRNEKRGQAMEKQIDANAQSVQFDPHGGFLEDESYG